MISKFTKQLKGAAVIGALFFGSNAFAQLGLTWAEMGPNDIAGRCRSIIVDNTDATGKKLFAAGVSGGVFKTSNGGSTWSPVNDQAQSLIVSCMGQDASGNVYFGTGETFGRGGDATGASGVLGGAGLSGFIGTGLYKINANTSTVVQVKDSSLFGNINEIAVAATNTIYVAAQKGFFISTDGGANFTEETASASGTLAAMDVKIAKNGDVYYSAGAKDYSLSAVYYAAAGSSVYTAITPTVITNRGRIEIAPSPVDPNYVYISIAKMKAAATASTGGLSAVLVSDTKGSTWSVISLGTAQFDPFTALNGTGGYGDYANTIAADPTNAKACYLGSDVYYSWVQIPSNPLGQGNWSQIGTNFPVPFAFYIHSNIHDVKFNAGNNSMYIATDAGIYKSVSNNSGFLPYNSGFNISQFNSVTFPNYPRVNQGTPTNVAIPYAGVAGGSVGNSLTYLPGNYLTGVQTSNSAGSTDAFQSDFSKILPKTLFYAGAYGSVLRTSDIDLTPASTFYDNSYRGGAPGGPGLISFANENTPMRLWENYQGGDYAIFYNENTQTQLANFLPAKAGYTVSNTRAQSSSRYDSIFVTTTSNKKIATTVVTTSVANTNSTATTFTINNTRLSGICKYDSIIINTSSTKLLSPPASQTITIKVSYSGSVASGYTVTGNASVTPVTNNMIFNYSGLTDSIRFTFNTPPNDSSKFTIRFKYKYSQNLTILPIYTGTTISSYNVLGEANTTSTTNNMVYLNANQIDSIRYTFATPVDSSIIKTDVKYRYDVGDVITLDNKDISGNFFTSSVTLTTVLSASIAPKPIVLVPLQKSARLAVGLKPKAVGENPSVFVVKRPLNFSINPDWVKIAGKNSRIDGPGGVASTVALASVSSGTNEVTRLEWSPSGKYIYYSVKASNSAYYLFRVSHLEFIGDSASEDYSGHLSSDIDSTGGNLRKSVLQRTTPIARFSNPITGIAINNSDTMVMVTTGGYNNTIGTVYYSNSSAAKMSMNITDASNFSVKNGTGLPLTPAYTGIFEMSNNNTALVGTEEGVYSTLDITQASPTWVKEGGGNFPNVPVFQLRQQTFPSHLCYNSGIIYAATHGRGIWSTDKFFTPYAISVEEQEAKNLTDSNIKVFPNPAGDATNLWFKASGDASYKVTVYDINGRIMMQEATGKLMEGEQRLTLNTTQLTSGMYFITVSGTNNFSANSKLVITH
ncbi:MAG: T9SS type A sorting domain-containing protein [Bacteroidia bacterium]|nr:T9SS type A sorting domain-containing protein [Bacteroidia bacterium]